MVDCRTVNRSRTEIISQILQAVSDNDEYGDGVTKTTLLYEAYLNSAQLREYLVALTIHGLLGYDPIIRRYNITEKGLRFLELYHGLREIMKEEEE